MTPDIKTLRALVDAATPGPWRAISGKGSATVQANECAVYINVSREGVMHPDTIARWQADARFIAAARSALPRLLDRVEELERERDAARRLAAERYDEAEACHALLGEPYQSGAVAALTTDRDRLRAEVERLAAERDADVANLRAGHCLAVIPETFIACGEGGSYCSETCRLRTLLAEAVEIGQRLAGLECDSAAEERLAAIAKEAAIRSGSWRKEQASPVCSTCGDTHRMQLRDREVMCTRCPTPCQLCRQDGRGAFCEATPCACDCHHKETR